MKICCFIEKDYEKLTMLLLFSSKKSFPFDDGFDLTTNTDYIFKKLFALFQTS